MDISQFSPEKQELINQWYAKILRRIMDTEESEGMENNATQEKEDS